MIKVEWHVLGDFGIDPLWNYSRVLYAYLHPNEKEILYIGKADGNTTLRKRWNRSGKEGFWEDLERERKIKTHVPIIGDLIYDGNFSSKLLKEIEGTLIFFEEPWGNIQNQKTVTARHGLEIKCTGFWPGQKKYNF